MIRLHRLNGVETVVNAELIETVESHGQETVLALTTGNKIVVRESVTEVIQQTVEYKKAVYEKTEQRSVPCPLPS
jgi:flagellar protein FlbD